MYSNAITANMSTRSKFFGQEPSNYILITIVSEINLLYNNYLFIKDRHQKITLVLLTMNINNTMISLKKYCLLVRFGYQTFSSIPNSCQFQYTENQSGGRALIYCEYFYSILSTSFQCTRTSQHKHKYSNMFSSGIMVTGYR